jgi:microsomal dipeptidase-like Zn-dependent dipeptidase
MKKKKKIRVNRRNQMRRQGETLSINLSIPLTGRLHRPLHRQPWGSLLPIQSTNMKILCSQNRETLSQRFTIGARETKPPNLFHQIQDSAAIGKKQPKEKQTLRKISLFITSFFVCAFVLTMGIAMAQSQTGEPRESQNSNQTARARSVKRVGYPVTPEAGGEAEPAAPVAATPAAKEMAGFYTSDDGGAYYIRQIGNKVYWFGEDLDGSYANVLLGTINGNKINARWWDVPKGKAKGLGEMVIEIRDAGDTLVKLSSTTPFAAKVFKKTVVHNEIVNGLPVLKGMAPEVRSRPAGFSGGEANLTGAWQGDDAATYYVRELPGGDVVWVAENNFYGGPGGYAQPAFTHVFIGKKINKLIVGDWVDVPKGKAVGKGVLSLNVATQQDLVAINPPVGIEVSKIWRSLPNSLRGFADLHTHPMINLSVGGKLVHGGPDVGSLLPTDSKCQHRVRARSIAQALGTDNSTHGGFGAFDNPCGDDIRKQVIDNFQQQNEALVTPDWAAGYPTFKDWPKWNDITHQKMWVDWLRRAYDGGERVLVALAMHNATIAAGVSGPGDGPTDDKGSADLQIAEIKSFVARHNDFMEVALSPADMRRIIAANKLAIVLGMEVDNIGNFNKVTPTADMVRKEINRLFNNGVRYIFPVHLIDNDFGGTAIYKDIFNLSNYREFGKFWDIGCAGPNEGITHKFKVEGFEFGLAAAKATKLNVDIFRDPPDPAKLNCSQGHKNKRDLQALGHTAIEEMMRLGMLIDIDHMSTNTVEETLRKAEAIPGGYPLVSGHNNFRSIDPSENSRTEDQLRRIGKLGGMFGLGSDAVNAKDFVTRYAKATALVGAGRVSFGTDLNGLVKGPSPRPGAAIYNSAFTMSKTGDKKWDYSKDGVAHYGMMADYLRDMSSMGANGLLLQTNILKNAEMFAQMWEKAEKQSRNP